jgi:hypothetical protein
MNKRGDCTQEWRSISVGFYLNGIFYTLGYVNPSDYGREVTFTLTENDLRDTGLDLNQNPRVQLVIRGVCRDNRNGEYQGYQVQFLSPSQAGCCNYSLSANTTEGNKVRVEIKQTGFGCSPLSSIDIKIKGKCANGNVVTGPIYTITDTSFREKSFTYDLGTYNCSIEGYDLEYIFYCQGKEQQRKVIPLKPPYSGDEDCCKDLNQCSVYKMEYIMNKRFLRFYYKFPYPCAFSREIRYVIYTPDANTIVHTVNSDEGYIDIPTSALRPVYTDGIIDCTIQMYFQFLALCPNGQYKTFNSYYNDYATGIFQNLCAENNGCETRLTLSKLYPVRNKEIYSEYTNICGSNFTPLVAWNQTKFIWHLGFEIDSTNYLHTIDNSYPWDRYNRITIIFTVGDKTFFGIGRMVAFYKIKGTISFEDLEGLRFFACASNFSVRIRYTCKRTNEIKEIELKVPDSLVPGLKGTYHSPWLNQDWDYGSYLAYVNVPTISYFIRHNQRLLLVDVLNPYFTCKDNFPAGRIELIRVSLYGAPSHLEEVVDKNGNSFLIKNDLNDPDNPAYITSDYIPNQSIRKGTYSDKPTFQEYLNYAVFHYDDPYSYPYERMRCFVMKNEEYTPGFKMIPQVGPEIGFIYYTTFIVPDVVRPRPNCGGIDPYLNYQPGFGFIKFNYVYQNNGSNQAGKFAYNDLYYHPFDGHLYFNIQFLPNYNKVFRGSYISNGNFYWEYRNYEVELMVITEIDSPYGKRMKVQFAEKLYDTNTPQEYKLKELLHIPPNEPIPAGFENEPILNRVGRFRIYLPNGIQDAIENKRLGFSLRIKLPNYGIHAFSLGTVVIFPTKEHFSGINY